MKAKIRGGEQHRDRRDEGGRRRAGPGGTDDRPGTAGTRRATAPITRRRVRESERERSPRRPRGRRRRGRAAVRLSAVARPPGTAQHDAERHRRRSRRWRRPYAIRSRTGLLAPAARPVQRPGRGHRAEHGVPAERQEQGPGERRRYRHRRRAGRAGRSRPAAKSGTTTACTSPPSPGCSCPATSRSGSPHAPAPPSVVSAVAPSGTTVVQQTRASDGPGHSRDDGSQRRRSAERSPVQPPRTRVITGVRGSSSQHDARRSGMHLQRDDGAGAGIETSSQRHAPRPARSRRSG